MAKWIQYEMSKEEFMKQLMDNQEQLRQECMEKDRSFILQISGRYDDRLNYTEEEIPVRSKQSFYVRNNVIIPFIKI